MADVLAGIVERKRTEVADRLRGRSFDVRPSSRSLRDALSKPGARFIMADDRDTDRTTIVETGGGGSGGVVAVVLLIIVVLVLLFLFRDQLGFGSKDTDINIPDKVEVNVN